MSALDTRDQVLPQMAKPKRDDVPVKLDREVVRLARIVAAYNNKHLAEYLSDFLLPLMRRELARWQKQAPGASPTP